MQSIYRSQKTMIHALIIVLGLAIVATTLYLTNHYFAVNFPSGISNQAGLCDLSGFFNCDGAAYSPLSNIAGVPVSIFGTLIGVLLMTGYLFNTTKFENTLTFILGLNLIGCIVLFIYSLAALGSLCPMCTIYYILSAGAFVLFKSQSQSWRPDPISLASIAAFFIAIGVGVYFYAADKIQKNDMLAESLIQQFQTLEKFDGPAKESEYKLITATDDFTAAPIHIIKFSDFQCPSL